MAIEEKRIGEGDRQRVLDALKDVDRVLGVLDPADWPEGQGARTTTRPRSSG